MPHGSESEWFKQLYRVEAGRQTSRDLMIMDFKMRRFTLCHSNCKTLILCQTWNAEKSAGRTTGRIILSAHSNLFCINVLKGSLENNLPFVMDDIRGRRSDELNKQQRGSVQMKRRWTVMVFSGSCGRNESFNKEEEALHESRWRDVQDSHSWCPTPTRLWRFDISAGKHGSYILKSRISCLFISSSRPGLDHEAGARPAGFSGTHPQFCGVCFCPVSGDHQLLVRGDQEGAQTILHGAAGEGEAVVLHPLQQLQHQRQPAGAVHLWDRGGEVPHEEVSHRDLFLLWAGRWHEW